MPRKLTALIAAASTAVVVAVASGEDRADAPPERSAAPPPEAKAAARPAEPAGIPLPKPRPKLVEPVAGATAGERTQAAPSGARTEAPAPGDEPAAADRPPTRAASSTRARRSTPSGGRDVVSQATALPNGIALAPLEAPEAVRTIVEAGNVIARSPYKWGGGHGRWVDTGYDCSGSVSYALAAAGLLGGPLDSSRLMGWGRAGPGKWVTIYSSPGHVFMEVAGLRFDTSGARRTGSRWQNELRGHAGFVARHPPNL